MTLRVRNGVSNYSMLPPPASIAASFPATKVCRLCNTEKPREAFAVLCSAKDNRNRACKRCLLQRVHAKKAMRDRRTGGL